MRKRILVADENPQDLAAARRALSTAGEVWDVEYSSGGEDALAIMARQPVDLILSDFRCPGAGGVSLLDVVGERFPEVLRVVYSSMISQDFILNCLKGTHLILSKPSDPATLTSTLRRALSLSGWIASDRIRAMVSKADALPSLPTLYFEVLRELRSKHASVQNVAEVVCKDLAITGKLLQVVNSAFYALPKKVTNPGEAVAILGMETVKSVVLCCQALSHIEIPRDSTFTQESLWSHSMVVAGLAKKVAWAETEDSQLADEAFTAGLLHDAGRWVMIANLGEDYIRVTQEASDSGEPLELCEERAFGVHHGHVGAYLLGLWGMPLPVLEAAALHHTPELGLNTHFCSATAVHIADALARQTAPQEYPFLLPALSTAHLRRLGLLDRVPLWRELLVTAPPNDDLESLREPRTVRNEQEPPRGHEVHPSGRMASSGWARWAMPTIGALVFCVSTWVIIQINRTAIDLSQVGTAEGWASTNAEAMDSRTVVDEVPSADLFTALDPVAAGDRARTSRVEDRQAAVGRQFRERMERLELRAIFYQLREPTALINDMPVRVGQQIEGMEVVSITPTEVGLIWEGLTNSLVLARGPQR